MKKPSYALSLLFLLLSLSSLTAPRPAPRPAGSPADEAAVAKAAEQLRLAMIDPTKAALMALTAPELSYGHSGGSLETQAEFVEALVSNKSDFVTIDISNQTITVVDNTALVRHKLLAQTSNKGVPGEAKLSVLQVWVKQKGNWVMLARQAVKLP